MINCTTRYIPNAKLITYPNNPNSGISIKAGPLSANNASEDPTINAAMMIAVMVR